jgi:aspartyl/glutamyl-tRNA(Asn/Gln) amidotransferase C subunit
MTNEKIDVLKVATLARLHISEAEASVMAPQLARILGHIATFASISAAPEANSTELVSSLSQQVSESTETTAQTTLAQDNPHVCTAPSEIFSQAPAHAQGQFAVPKFVDH